MDASYFRSRLILALSRTYPHLAHATDLADLSESILDDLTKQLVIQSKHHVKFKRRRDGPVVDLTNTTISHGYAHDVFTLCGGHEN